MVGTLVLLRHGQSVWNRDQRFTGWYDAALTELGRHEAAAAGEALRDRHLLPDVVHTSLQSRAIQTAEIALAACDRSWIPVRRHWRLNERHYGDLTGRSRPEMIAEVGEEQVHLWRRSWDVRPPELADDNEWSPNADERYRSVPPQLRPTGESLRDVVQRIMPYWYDAIVPDLQLGLDVLVAAHGNSLRALVKHLDRIADTDIPMVEIETGRPFSYDLDEDSRAVETRPLRDRYL